MTTEKESLKHLFYILTLFVLFTVYGHGQTSVKKIDPTKLPKGINYEGKIKNAVQWIDSLGENIVIVSETGVHKSKKFKHESDGRDAELFAYHYLIKGDTALQTWRVYDFISDCPLDIEAQFIKNSLQITDLNKDGVSEVWIMYKTVCHGDVSPFSMKIIMYEGNRKYAIRGHNKVQISDKEFYGGDYKFDKEFIDAPQEFLEFAKKLWSKNIIQKWEE